MEDTSEEYKKVYELSTYYQEQISLEESQYDAKINYISFMLMIVSNKLKNLLNITQILGFVKEILD